MVGEKIKEFRKKANITLRALAEQSGISKSTLSDIENNKTNPTTNTLEKIAEALKISVKDLFNTESTYEYPNGGHSTIKESPTSYDEELKTPEEAIQFILKQPSIMGFGGFDIKKMTDDEIVEFANELLRQLKLISYKYKR